MMRVAFALLLAASVPPAARALDSREPVRQIATSRIGVTSPAGRGALAVYATADWAQPQPDAKRALIIIHGDERGATGILQATETMFNYLWRARNETMIFVPHFLEVADASAHGLDPIVLRWYHKRWEGGESAAGPAPISSLEAIDAMLLRLADRRIFPNLAQVVIVGHSGGGQLVQRYAVAGSAEDALARLGIRVRYVVSNPSSYVYFSADRPAPHAACADYNKWKYGIEEPPPYVAHAPLTFAALEARYVERDVIYLLGLADSDPRHPGLDRSCAGKAEGPNRLARGLAYYRYLKARHPAPAKFAHRVWIVPGVGHDSRKMYTSDCGMAALFDSSPCGTVFRE